MHADGATARTDVRQWPWGSLSHFPGVCVFFHMLQVDTLLGDMYPLALGSLNGVLSIKGIANTSQRLDMVGQWNTDQGLWIQSVSGSNGLTENTEN